MNRRNTVTAPQFGVMTCPYCFKKFGHEYVHFKAETVKTKMDVDSYQDRKKQDRQTQEIQEDLFGFGMEEADEAEADGTDAELEQMQAYLEQDDEAYERFWADYPGSKENNNWKYARRQFLHRSESLKNAGKGLFVGEGSYVRDNDGFVCAAYDTEFKKTSIRICPHCHNPLPPSYGKYPVKFISVIGITFSGKTVYLSQLLKQFSVYMSKGGCSAFRLSNHEKEFYEKNAVKQNQKLPIGTPNAILSTPLFYNIKNRRNETYTLVLYDIAGENCVDPEKMEKFGRFIVNADAFILLLDPEQFAMAKTNFDMDAEQPSEVLNAMYNTFLTQRHDRPQTPIAASFSKSDKLREHFAEGTRIYKDVETIGEGGFDIQTYLNVKGEVKQFLNRMPDGRTFIADLESLFEHNGYFAFTALNCEVEEVGTDAEGRALYAPVETPDPKRIEEPLLWILNRLNIIQEVRKNPKPESKKNIFGKLFGR